MSEAKNAIPIYHKITLSIKEANGLTGIGINRIEDHLREPNCPFVLFVGTKKPASRFSVPGPTRFHSCSREHDCGYLV